MQAWTPAWTLNGRLLRPAMVVVAKAPGHEAAGSGEARPPQDRLMLHLRIKHRRQPLPQVGLNTSQSHLTEGRRAVLRAARVR